MVKFAHIFRNSLPLLKRAIFVNQHTQVNTSVHIEGDYTILQLVKFDIFLQILISDRVQVISEHFKLWFFDSSLDS